VLGVAREGTYPASRLELVPRKLRDRFFDRVAGGRRGEERELFTVRPELRERIVFKRLNLAKPPLPMTGPLDIIFCRNVMIYFDRATRQKVVDEAERLLHPDGYYFSGHSEPLLGLRTRLKAVRPAVYQLGAAVQAAAGSGGIA
jgi:chemotaxis protein methyltransferase CheR